MTIVCATHFTDSSSEAVAVAAQLARRTGQRLWLASVVPGVAVGPNSGGAKETAVNSALHLEAGVLREQGLQVETALLHGKIERAIGRLCNDQGAQLLVVGDTSHTSPGLFATPIDRLAADVAVPMLVVRSRKPFEAWSRGERALRVLLAVDYTWSSALARDWLSRLAHYGPLEVLATHVWTPADEHARRGRGGPLSDSEEASLAELLTRETEVALAGLPRNVTSRVQLEIGRGHVGALLLDLARREKMDMVVLGTHPKKGLLARLTSVSHEVLADALMAVALVPADSPLVASMGARPPPPPQVTPHA